MRASSCTPGTVSASHRMSRDAKTDSQVSICADPSTVCGPSCLSVLFASSGRANVHAGLVTFTARCSEAYNKAMSGMRGIRGGEHAPLHCPAVDNAWGARRTDERYVVVIYEVVISLEGALA